MIKKREGIQSHSRPPEPKLETTGIKSVSYYAPREITDNWRELWDKAEKPGRPKMEENIRRKKNESPEPMSRPDSLNGSNPEIREEDGASKASVNRGCGEAYKGPGASGKLSSGSGGRREDGADR